MTLTTSPQFRTASIYVVIAVVWIWFSDRALEWMVHDPQRLTWLQSLKGWLFVLGSGVLLYAMVGHAVRRLAVANAELVAGNEQSLRVLVEAMDARHKETSDHSDRVTRMSVGLGRLAGMKDEALRNLRFGALLHDIGKLALPDAILIKPGKLDEAETALMRTHPKIGHDMLQKVGFLRAASDVPYSHHERWDGAGYPQGLRGEAIPLAARVFSVVDVWDALSHPRVYKPAWPQDEVIAYLRQVAGSQLDPHLVALFLDHLDELKLLAHAETGAPSGS
ncbi:HD-GYP domain-containing protein [Rhodanobacter glycinis]|uniref:HD-GYP domain-containing protein n=1 Tax=Rhodanobacter glycinis TaxID=582702 RepID=A0A5B9E4A3_9GAMM|nr:HD-GYP domain-containing protein [Rhodanobacter glycinis]QEE25097.1 HD-GYP domain-containing protein [Rhodanobacter glycinis]